MNAYANGLKRFLTAAARVADAIAVTVLLLLILTIFVMVLERNLLKMGLVWLEDLARYLQIWLVYTAAIALTMKDDHITLDFLYARMPTAWQLQLKRFSGALSLLCCAMVSYLATNQALTVARQGEVSASGAIPAIVGYASLPVAFLLMAAASLYTLLNASVKPEVGGT